MATGGVFWVAAREQYDIDLKSVFTLLGQQAENARILIEGYSDFWVMLPDFEGLLGSFGVEFESFLEKVPLPVRWHVSATRHLVKARENINGSEEISEEDNEDLHWVKLYGKGEEEEAEKCAIQKIGLAKERNERAQIYNDLGYIRCGNKLKKYHLGRKDLETAVDLHYRHLQLALLNLAYCDLEEGYYSDVIEKIEEALLLTISPIQTDVAYLRLRFPENHLGYRVRYEQHPANVIEAAYINLAYAILQLEGYEKAFHVLEEGLELFPSSACLKHGKARFLLHRKRADLAHPIYSEIFQAGSMARYMEYEVKYFLGHKGGKKRKKTKRK